MYKTKTRYLFTVTLSEEEAENLNKLAKIKDSTKSAIVRELITNAYNDAIKSDDSEA